MEVGYQMVFQNWHGGMVDEEMYQREIELGLLTEELGFDSIWSVEHHFDDYSFCPDNMQLLSYFAAKTSRIKLGTGAVILPWNDPLRVIEKMAMLDIMSNGRALFGMGRGLAKYEYDSFRQDMGESRERFDEAAPIILNGLETGFAEGDGRFYKQPRVEIRPRPPRSFKGRVYSVAMSPESVLSVANLGARMMSFVQYDIEKHMPAIEIYRDTYREKQGEEAPNITLTDFMFCHKDAAVAEKVARERLGQYYLSIIKHYDMAGMTFSNTKGYQAYAEGARMIREAGLEKSADDYVNAQIWGTPEQIIERYRQRIAVVGDFDATWTLSFGGIPYGMVRDSMTLLAKEVIPELKKLGAEAAAAKKQSLATA